MALPVSALPAWLPVGRGFYGLRHRPRQTPAARKSAGGEEILAARYPSGPAVAWSRGPATGRGSGGLTAALRPAATT